MAALSDLGSRLREAQLRGDAASAERLAGDVLRRAAGQLAREDAQALAKCPNELNGSVGGVGALGGRAARAAGPPYAHAHDGFRARRASLLPCSRSSTQRAGARASGGAQDLRSSRSSVWALRLSAKDTTTPRPCLAAGTGAEGCGPLPRSMTAPSSRPGDDALHARAATSGRPRAGAATTRAAASSEPSSASASTASTA